MIKFEGWMVEKQLLSIFERIQTSYQQMSSKQTAPTDLKDIISIENFKLPPEEVREIYPRAYALPEFFTHNLLSDHRVVKIFTGPLAIVQAYYYQLMKLSLEIEVEGINYRDIIYNRFVKNELFIDGQLGDEYFTDFQYRKFIKDFIELVEADDIPNFQKKVQQYPIIDQILIKIFKMIVPYPLLMKEESRAYSAKSIAKQILTFLSDIFETSFCDVGNCFKFDQSDTFIYLESKEQVYLAFNEEFEEEEEIESEFKSTFVCGQGNSFQTKYHSNISKTAYQLSVTVNKAASSLQASKSIKSNYEVYRASSKTPVSASEQHFSKKKHKLHDQHHRELQGRYTESQYWKQEDSHSNRAKHQKYEKNDKRTSCDEKQTIKSQHLDSLKNNQSTKTLYILLKKPSQQSFSNVKPIYKENKDYYDEFTSSFILDQMASIYRKPIRSIKDKYKEEKRKSIKNFF